jgi:uncharacterized RDD family membrane protein YckC
VSYPPPPPGQGPPDDSGNPNNPYSQPQQPYGYPQQPGQPPQGGQPGYGYPQQPPPGQNPYAQPPGAPPAGYGYGYSQQPGGVPPVASGYLDLPHVGSVQLATMGQRFLARLIDCLIVGVVMGIVLAAGLGGTLGMASSSVDQCDAADPGYSDCVQAAQSKSMGALGVFMVVVLSLAVLMLLYEWLMIAFKGATFGKMALSLRVLKAADGRLPGLGAGFVRYIIPIVGSFICYIGLLLVWLSPFFDKSGKLQGWHDRAAGTVVVKS